MSKDDILAKAAPAQVKSKIAGCEVTARGFTSSEVMAEEKIQNRFFELLAVCITDPVFTEDELRGLGAGQLEPVWHDIIKASEPKKSTVKNS